MKRFGSVLLGTWRGRDLAWGCPGLELTCLGVIWLGATWLMRLGVVMTGLSSAALCLRAAPWAACSGIFLIIVPHLPS